MRRRHLSWLALPLAAIALIAPGGGNAAAPRHRQSSDVIRPGFQGEDSDAPGDLDLRGKGLQPTAAQRSAARALGAKARWNQFGTPSSLFNRHGYLSGPTEGKAPDVARAWVRRHAGLFRLTPEGVEPSRLEVVANTPLYESPDNRRRMHGLAPLAKDSELPHVVLFRQLFDGVPANVSGTLAVALDKHNRVTYASSSITGDPRVTNTDRLDPVTAFVRAAADVDWSVPAADVTVERKVASGGFTKLRVPGNPLAQHVRLRAVPTPRRGVRLAWEVSLVDNTRVGHAEPLGYVTYVDAETGKVIYRENSVDHVAGGTLPMQALPDPRWKIFPNSPNFPQPGIASPDNRQVWCWVAGAGCDLVIGGTTGPRVLPQLKFAYDEEPANASVAAPSFTSRGNNADTTTSYASHLTPDAYKHSTTSLTRDYTYAFTDQWHTSNCNFSGNYAGPPFNDADAAINNLFVNYGRMHDWSYYLGFTESTWNMQQVNFGEDAGDGGLGGDPETGQAQAGGAAGAIVFTGRDNANQITQADGIPGVTNQYLWHPLQAGFYSPCVDGAYDMSVVGHEYTHAISNRMIDGPTNNIVGPEGLSMGESWSDLSAMEYINGYGFAPIANENPYAIGPYATGQLQTGIRNYGMNDSPLTYADLAYDGNGATSPHSDGEIWSATNFEIRKALIKKYDAQYPSTNKTLQFQCADGLKPSTQCPGNRRWIQLMFDAFLIQAGNAGMSAAAEAQIAADVTRYGGANAKEIWAAYAKRGLGDNSEDGGTPDYTSPKEATEASVRFQAVPVDGGGVPSEMFVHPGPYTARTSEVAIGQAGLPSEVVRFMPGTYNFTARADGYGSFRFTRTFTANETATVQIPMRKNLASAYNNAEATGDGGNFEALIDDTEETNWAFLGPDVDQAIAGRQVTVDLTGDGAHLVREVAVSAVNRPQATSDPYDDIVQSRFAALRSFEILTCDASSGADCEEDDSYTKIYTSPVDAFPAGRPRPLSPNLLLKTFDVPDTNATHVRLRVLTNQCTGSPTYTVEENPVGEALSNPDCVDGFTFATLTNTDVDPEEPPPPANNTQRHRVRAAELQVYSSVTPATVLSSTTTPPPVTAPPATTPPPPKPPVAKPPTIPTTGISPAVGVVALLMTAGAAFGLRRRRTA